MSPSHKQSHDLKTSVVVYSMGSDKSAAITKALQETENLSVRQIYTLNRTAIAQFLLKNPEKEGLPDHIRDSEAILTDDLPNEKSLHFITLVSDPFSRHIHHAFTRLKQQVNPDMLGYTLSNAPALRHFLQAISPTHTTEWFTKEYLESTGIDVYTTPFDHKKGYVVFSVGPHQLLVMSAHVSLERQTEIISSFLKTPITPITEDVSVFDGLISYFTAQVLSNGNQEIAQTFWDTRYAKHFFAPQQIFDFKKKALDHIDKMRELERKYADIAPLKTRDALVEEALSPVKQVSDLSQFLEEVMTKRSFDGTKTIVESILRQYDRAQRNLLLAAMRTFSKHDLHRSVDFSKKWHDQLSDERITKTLAMLLQKAGEITMPLHLLNKSETLSESQILTQRKLSSHQTLLEEPFPFSRRSKCLYKPQKKRILYNAASSLPYHASGYATRTHGIVKGIHDAGYDIHVMTRKGYPGDTGLIPYNNGQEVIDHIPYTYDTGKGEGQHHIPLHDYIEKSAEYLVQRGKKLKPALIHTASNYMCGMAGVEAARRLGIPSLYEMRGLWHVTRASKEPEYAHTDHFALAQKMELETAKACDHILSITVALKEWLMEHGLPEHKISIAPNAVDLEKFSLTPYDEAYAKTLNLQGKMVIGYIGSFVHYEGLDLLIHALSLLKPFLREKVVLLWAGRGPALNDLFALAKEKGVFEMIHFLGLRPFAEVQKIYSIVDLCVFPRRDLPICEIISPLKPFEAMAMEKAVLVSSVRPLREIVDSEHTGLVFEKDNVDDLVQQLERFLLDKDLRIRCGKGGRQWIETTRNWKNIASSIANLYNKII